MLPLCCVCMCVIVCMCVHVCDVYVVCVCVYATVIVHKLSNILLTLCCRSCKDLV